VTLLEAAQSLGVTAATLRQQIANGKLKARKVGRDWHVQTREVERYRDENRRLLRTHTHRFVGQLCKCGATA
jgi:excisionase family DNA binding protein